MRVISFILHLLDFVLFTFRTANVIPYEFAIMAEIFAIYNKIN